VASTLRARSLRYRVKICIPANFLFSIHELYTRLRGRLISMNTKNIWTWWLGLVMCVPGVAYAGEPRVPTERESSVFSSYLKNSGLLRKNHRLKKLIRGAGFQVISRACRDGDDLYFLSTETGALIEVPPGESLSASYPNGTAGAWWMFFKRDPKTRYFEFMGAETLRGVKGSLGIESGLCPDISVSTSGRQISKTGG